MVRIIISDICTNDTIKKYLLNLYDEFEDFLMVQLIHKRNINKAYIYAKHINEVYKINNKLNICEFKITQPLNLANLSFYWHKELIPWLKENFNNKILIEDIPYLLEKEPFFEKVKDRFALISDRKFIVFDCNLLSIFTEEEINLLNSYLEWGFLVNIILIELDNHYDINCIFNEDIIINKSKKIIVSVYDFTGLLCIELL